MNAVTTTFVLVFEGLMLVYGPSEDRKSHVAIVNAPKTHMKPYVLFIDKEDGKQKTIRLEKDDEIKLSLDNGLAETLHKFDNDVVTINHYLRLGNVHGDVINNKPHDGVLVRVTLPKGELTTYRTFRDKVSLRKWFAPDTRCFPRYVLLGASTTTDVTITITKKKTSESYAVDKNGYIVFSNGAEPGHEKESHFHEYDRLLSLFGWLANAKILDEVCDEPEANIPPPWLNDVVKEFLDKGVDRIPNGDCGVVDYP